MSFTLIASNSGARFHFNNAGWRYVLTLAASHGWKPSGTERADCPDWDGGYDSNDCQRVTAHDALKLSAALSKWLLKPSDDPDWRAYLSEFVDFARQSGGFELS